MLTGKQRRRTQIRLAQRAYRQRKETAITALTRRASDLTNVIDQMNTSFMRLNEDLRQSRLINPDIGLQLKLDEMVKNYARLVQEAKTANEDTFVDSDEGAGPETRPGSEPHPSPQLKTASLPGVQHGRHDMLSITQSADHSGQQRRSPALNHGTYYDVSPEEGVEEVKKVEISTVGTSTRSKSLKQPQATRNMNLGFRPDSAAFIPAITIEPSMAYYFPGVYASFARRLGLTTIERAFHLACNTQSRPHAARRKFHFLRWSPFELREKFSRMLASTSSSGPMDVDVPGIALGGAGTHYPRRDAFGNMSISPNSCTVYAVNGRLTGRAVNHTDSDLSHEMTVDLAGFEGEWLDASDVEGYLREKGIVLDPHASVVEGEVLGAVTSVHEPGLPTMINTGWHGWQSPIHECSPGSSADVPLLSASRSSSGRSSVQSDGPLINTWAQQSGLAFIHSDDANDQHMSMAKKFRNHHDGRRTPVAIDVSKFIEGMCFSSPGYLDPSTREMSCNQRVDNLCRAHHWSDLPRGGPGIPAARRRQSIQGLDGHLLMICSYRGRKRRAMCLTRGYYA